MPHVINVKIHGRNCYVEDISINIDKHRFLQFARCLIEYSLSGLSTHRYILLEDCTLRIRRLLRKLVLRLLVRGSSKCTLRPYTPSRIPACRSVICFVETRGFEGPTLRAIFSTRRTRREEYQYVVRARETRFAILPSSANKHDVLS